MASSKDSNVSSGGLNGSSKDIEESRYAKMRASLLGENGDHSLNGRDDIIRPTPSYPPSGSQSSGNGGSVPPPNYSSGRSSSNWIPLLIFILLIGVGVYFLTQKSEEKAKSVTLEVTRREAVSQQTAQVPMPKEIQQQAAQTQVIVQPMVVIKHEAVSTSSDKEVIYTKKSFNCPTSTEGFATDDNIEYVNANSQSLHAGQGCLKLVVSGKVTKVDASNYMLAVDVTPDPNTPFNQKVYMKCGTIGGRNDSSCVGFVNQWSGSRMNVIVGDGGYIVIE